MKTDIPVVLACFDWALQAILKEGALLSKKEMRLRKIDFNRSHTADEGLEHRLETFDDVTLFIDPTFARGQFYGGPFGPRLIFDSQLIYEKGVFVLPMDQSAYDPLQKVNKFPQFNLDKCVTREKKNKLIQDYLHSDRAVAPEVHVPNRIDLKWLRVLLVRADEFDRYAGRPELEHVKVITYGKEDFRECMSKTHLPLRRAFEVYLSSEENVGWAYPINIGNIGEWQSTNGICTTVIRKL